MTPYPPHVYKTPRKVWFFGDDLIMVLHENKAAKTVTIKNLTQDKIFTMVRKDFLSYRKKAYNITEAAKLLGYNPSYLSTRAKEKGVWPRPVGRLPGGKQKHKGPAYYHAGHIETIRRMQALTHKGFPRKDGGVTNNRAITEEELSMKMNTNVFTYVETIDGRLIPIFDRDV